MKRLAAGLLIFCLFSSTTSFSAPLDQRRIKKYDTSEEYRKDIPKDRDSMHKGYDDHDHSSERTPVDVYKPQGEDAYIWEEDVHVIHYNEPVTRAASRKTKGGKSKRDKSKKHPNSSSSRSVKSRNDKKENKSKNKSKTEKSKSKSKSKSKKSSVSNTSKSTDSVSHSKSEYTGISSDLLDSYRYDEYDDYLRDDDVLGTILLEPTQSPSLSFSTTEAPTVSPSGSKQELVQRKETLPPTANPTVDPTADPTADPTTDPTHSFLSVPNQQNFQNHPEIIKPSHYTVKCQNNIENQEQNTAEATAELVLTFSYSAETSVDDSSFLDTVEKYMAQSIADTLQCAEASTRNRHSFRKLSLKEPSSSYPYILEIDTAPGDKVSEYESCIAYSRGASFCTVVYSAVTLVLFNEPSEDEIHQMRLEGLRAIRDDMFSDKYISYGELPQLLRLNYIRPDIFEDDVPDLSQPPKRGGVAPSNSEEEEKRGEVGRKGLWIMLGLSPLILVSMVFLFQPVRLLFFTKYDESEEDTEYDRRDVEKFNDESTISSLDDAQQLTQLQLRQNHTLAEMLRQSSGEYDMSYNDYNGEENKESMINSAVTA